MTRERLFPIWLLFAGALLALRFHSSEPGFTFPSQELAALHDLWNSTDGYEWDWRMPYIDHGIPWNFTNNPNANPCEEKWQGVFCTANCSIAPCNINVLELSNYGLDGTLPSSLVNLKALKLLDLSLNPYLSSSLPESIGRLSLLLELYLVDCALTSSIPDSFANLTSLVAFYVTENLLSGPIPDIFSNYNNLANLGLAFNRFTSTIPSSVGNMTMLNLISMFNNLLSGPIQSFSYTNLTQLEILDLGGNMLEGTVPSEWSTLVKLLELDASRNLLNGTIPESWSNLDQLELMILFENAISGSIPKHLPANVVDLYLNLNVLTHDIPLSFYNLSKLWFAILGQNYLTSSIHASFINTSSIRIIEFNDNLLTDYIPPELFSLPSLLELNLQNNGFYGPLDMSNSSILSYLKVINVSGNHLTGAIPTGGLNLNLQYFEELNVQDNRFTSISQEFLFAHSAIKSILATNNLITGVGLNISLLINLTEFEIGQNMFHGDLEFANHKFAYLSALDLSNNFFTGTVIERVWYSEGLFLVDMSNNLLSSSLPMITHVNRGDYLDLSVNMLTGNVNSFLQNFYNTSIILLSNNLFTGSIDMLSRPILEHNISVQNLDISNNAFTGKIKSAFYRSSPRMTVLVAGVNCLEIELTEDICLWPLLESLVLDGLSTATPCRQLFYPGTTDGSYRLKLSKTSSLPSCLFGLPQLQTLHLSGVQLTGTLCSGLVVGDRLEYLSLSHNQLQGSIPNQLILRDWINFDLSFNGFRGNLPSSLQINDTESFSVQNNRLSGAIPDGLLDAQNINILQGNLFSCDSERKTLPKNDPDYNGYQCGSNEVNAALYVWLGLAFLVVVAVSLVGNFDKMMSVLHKPVVNMRQSLQISNQSEVGGLIQFYDVCWRLRKIVGLVSLFSIVVAIPVYFALSLTYGTVQEQFAFVLSICFLSGLVPAVVIAVILLLFIFLLQYLFIVGTTVPKSSGKENVESSQKYDRWQRAWFILLTSANIFLVVVVNGLFVYANEEQINVVALTAVTFALSIFKLVWVSIIIAVGGPQEAGKPPLMDSWTLIMLTCFNNILAPMIAQAFVSTGCLYYSIEAEPVVSASFFVSSCRFFLVPVVRKVEYYIANDILGDSLFLLCSAELRESSYAPPFIYGYRCSSSLIKSFAFVFLVRYVLSGLLFPIVLFLLKMWQETLASKQAQANEMSSFYLYITMLLPVILQPTEQFFSTIQQASSVNNQSNNNENENAGMTTNPLRRSSIETSSRDFRPFSTDSTSSINVSEDEAKVGSSITSSNGNISSFRSSSRRPALSKLSFSVKFLGDLAVLLTFGVVFPPLAVVIAWSMVVEMQIQLLGMARLVQLARSLLIQAGRLTLAASAPLTAEASLEAGDSMSRSNNSSNANSSMMIRDILAAINADFADVEQSLFQALPWIVLLAAIFWSFPLFDTLGNAVGSFRAVWIVLVVASSPLWLPAGQWLHKRFTSSEADQKTNVKVAAEEEKDIEDVPPELFRSTAETKTERDSSIVEMNVRKSSVASSAANAFLQSK